MNATVAGKSENFFFAYVTNYLLNITIFHMTIVVVANSLGRMPISSYNATYVSANEMFYVK